MKAPFENAPRFFPEPSPDDQSSYAHRQLIGVVGLVLPVLLWLLVGWRPITGAQPWEPLGSISAYYYTGAVSAFAGGLTALALFLFTYRGYDNEFGHRDRVAAIIAGSAAVLVAFFPTGVSDGQSIPSWWTPPIGKVHYASAAVLFGSFIFFCLFQFPKSGLAKENLSGDKRVRNAIYYTCGAAILACMGWAVVASNAGMPIFWPETLALEFFAVSWLVKGHADHTALAVGHHALYYGRHPRQFVSNAWKAIRGKRDVGPVMPQNGA